MHVNYLFKVQAWIKLRILYYEIKLYNSTKMVFHNAKLAKNFIWHDLQCVELKNVLEQPEKSVLEKLSVGS